MTSLKRLILAVFAVLLLGGWTSPAIDCGNAFQPAELAVCRLPFLADLDRRMAAQYWLTHQRTPAQDRPALQAQQQQWERYRNNCGANIGCLRALYHRRIDELAHWQ